MDPSAGESGSPTPYAERAAGGKVDCAAGIRELPMSALDNGILAAATITRTRGPNWGRLEQQGAVITRLRGRPGDGQENQQQAPKYSSEARITRSLTLVSSK